MTRGHHNVRMRLYRSESWTRNASPFHLRRGQVLRVQRQNDRIEQSRIQAGTCLSQGKQRRF